MAASESAAERASESGEIVEDLVERLEDLEELYRLTPVGHCVVDRDLRYTRANDVYAAIVGYEIEDLIGRTMADVIPESARGEAIDKARQAIETGEPVLDVELRRLDPEHPERERTWLVNVHPVRRRGEITGAMAVLQNITEVRRTEESARSRLIELASIYRNAPVGLSLIDRDLRYVRVNQQIADMNGVEIGEMIGKSYRDMSPETADVAEPFFRGIMDRGKSITNLETRSRPPADLDNEHIFLLNAEPVRDAAGQVVGLLAAVQDITKRRRAEEEADGRLRQLQTVYANTPLGLCFMDRSLRIVHLSPSFAQLSSKPLEAQIGATVQDVLPDEIARQLVPQLEEVALTGAFSIQTEVVGRPAALGGVELIWIASSYAVVDDDGEVSGVVTVLQDVTDLARRQHEIQATRDRLAEAQHVANIGSWEWSIIDDAFWWSSELYSIFDAPASYEPTFVDFFERVVRRDREKVRKQLDQTVRDGGPARMTFRIERPDGSERLLFTAARLERDPSGAPARLVGTCQDITERSARPKIPRRA